MIVVLDTNAMHGDVYAERTHAQTLISAAGDRFVVRVPSVVIEEMVRQFPERIGNATAVLKEARHDVTAFGFELPTLPDKAEAIAAYRDKLLANLDEDGVDIAPPPRSAGVIAEWVAERRQPIPGDGGGTVDAQIWLTAVEEAEDADGDTVFLISNNSDDFADPDDKTKLHPNLLEDLREKGLGEDAVVLLPRLIDFIKREVEPNQEAEGKARALFANPERRKGLVSEIEDAIGWFPLGTAEDEWYEVLEADIEDSNLTDFDIAEVNLVRADAVGEAVSMTIEALGEANLDLTIDRAQAVTLPDDSLIQVWEFDIECPSASANAQIPARLLAEVRLDEKGIGVSVDEVSPILDEDVLAVLRAWSKAKPADLVDLVGASFDQAGEQEASQAWPRAVERIALSESGIYARVEFGVEYANPVDEGDVELSASNNSEITIDIEIAKPEFQGLKCSGVSEAPGAFPD